MYGVRHNLALDDMRFSGHTNLYDRLEKNTNQSMKNLKPEQEFQVSPQSGFAPDSRGAYPLGRFAPYLERPCFRLATPAASSVPRIMW